MTGLDIRELLLTVARDQQPRGPTDANLSQSMVFEEATKRLGGRGGNLDQAILTQWHDLMRTGVLAWGLNLANPNPPWFHFTERGRRALESLNRDPSNPAGYLRHVGTMATLNPVADSYLREGLSCFAAGLHKAAAVMIGAASENLIFELRDVVAKRLPQGPKSLTDWRVKTVLDGLYSVFDSKKGDLPKDLREAFGSYWLAFAQQIRATRNDAGHPSSIDPVTEEGVHASFLVFPELAKLSNQLGSWATINLK